LSERRATNDASHDVVLFYGKRTNGTMMVIITIIIIIYMSFNVSSSAVSRGRRKLLVIDLTQ